MTTFKQSSHDFEESHGTNEFHTNGASTESTRAEGTSDEGLRILFVGASIGGLTAAIGLRKQGHEVLVGLYFMVFKQSSLASRPGAAVHLAPNVNGILRRLGIYAEEFGANLMLKETIYTKTGALVSFRDLAETNEIWQHPWLHTHRVHYKL